MSCGDEVRRMILKRSFTAGEKPTIPPNEDHRSGLWSPTDIYIGEQFFNAVDGTLYTRSDNGIEQVSVSNTGFKRAVISVTQTGTNAPVITQHLNEIGTLGSVYNGVGQYEITSSGLFTSGKTQVVSQYMNNNRRYAECNVKPADPTNAIQLISQNSAYVNANDILVNYFIEIIIWE
jgi:hypothetical protein